MAFDLSSITKEKVIRAPRIILLGVEKIGKSTWAANSNMPIMFPMKKEEGIDEFAIPKFPTLNSYQEVIEAFKFLCNNDLEHRTNVLDSSSTLEKLIHAKICDLKNVSDISEIGYNKGYELALQFWGEVIDYLDYLRNAKNMASIVICHTKIKRFDNPLGSSYDQYQADISANAWNMLARWADFIGFANTETITKKEEIGFNKEKNKAVDPYNGQRFLYTQKNPAYPAGGRGVYGRLPARLPLDWNAFIEAVSNAS